MSEEAVLLGSSTDAEEVAVASGDWSMEAACAEEARQLPVRVHNGLPPWLIDTFLLHHGAGRRGVRAVLTSVEPVGACIIGVLGKLPFWLRRGALLRAWKVWLCLHKILPRWLVARGLSDTMSMESHALHNVVWFARFIPVTLAHMRFGLEQIQCLWPWPKEAHLERVVVPERRTTGYYVRLCPQPAKKVLFWVYGGAFFGGSASANRGVAAHYAKNIGGCDVFLPDIRWVPEITIPEAVGDACRAYEWLTEQTASHRPDIILAGVSSGAGICMRLAQLCQSEPEEAGRYFVAGKAPPKPAGAFLIGASVNYVQSVGAVRGLMRNVHLDDLVNQSVVELGRPLINKACGGADKAKACSPLYRSMDGLCPVYISVSEHEATYDENCQLLQRLREANVDAEFATVKYQSHVFQLFAEFLPEARAMEGAVFAWAKRLGL